MNHIQYMYHHITRLVKINISKDRKLLHTTFIPNNFLCEQIFLCTKHIKIIN